MGNVQMEADQIRYRGQFRNVQEALDNGGGGGGGTTVVANPSGAATADLSKLQVGESIYGIPAAAAKIAYDNTESGLTADDVQEAIDELIGAIPGVATASAPGIVQPDGDTITIEDGVISAVGGSGSGETYSTTETPIGTWIDGSTIYRKVVNIGALPNNTVKYVDADINTAIRLINLRGLSYTEGGSQIILPYVTDSLNYMIAIQYNDISAATNPDSIYVTTHYNYTPFATTYAIIDYIKIS